MKYQIVIERKALDFLQTLPGKFQRQIVSKIDSLADNPFPPGCKKLLSTDFYRLRSGNYIIIYSVSRQKITVFILRIGDRKDIYKKLPKG
ncbi:MAG: type II toxin-antitoxin system RelE/ParE family toxin [Sedimentisphaerales bacterium]|jgi:mRNA interferase RelE/StbE